MRPKGLPNATPDASKGLSKPLPEFSLILDARWLPKYSEKASKIEDHMYHRDPDIINKHLLQVQDDNSSDHITHDDYYHDALEEWQKLEEQLGGNLPEEEEPAKDVCSIRRVRVERWSALGLEEAGEGVRELKDDGEPHNDGNAAPRHS